MVTKGLVNLASPRSLCRVIARIESRRRNPLAPSSVIRMKPTQSTAFTSTVANEPLGIDSSQRWHSLGAAIAEMDSETCQDASFLVQKRIDLVCNIDDDDDGG